jgi:H+/Cl- antiporter ClcA
MQKDAEAAFSNILPDGAIVRNKDLAVVAKSALVGLLAGVMVTLYRFTLGMAKDLSYAMYELLREQSAYIPYWVAFVAILGLLTGLLVSRNAMISGSGIPQVKGVIFGYLKDRWLATLAAKFTGGLMAQIAGLSLGREGPSIQIASCVAQGVGELACRSRTEREILIAGGASAGLAAAFNAPLAGVIFAFEEVFRYLSPAILLATTVAAVVADYVSKIFIKSWPLLSFTVERSIPMNSYWVVLVIGVLTGLIGALHNRVLLSVNKWYGGLWSKRAAIFRPLPIFLIAVVVGLTFPAAMGSGLPLTQNLSAAQGVRFLLMLFTVKFAFSIISFSSGAPGGIFFPLLALGATGGAIFLKAAASVGAVDESLFINFVTLGMAGLFTATVRAPITGIVLLTEMTGSFSHLLPLTMVSIISYIVAGSTGVDPVYDSLLEDMTGAGGERAAQFGNRSLIDATVREGSRPDGARVRDLALPRRCRVLSVKRCGRDVHLRDDTRICAGDVLTILSDGGGEREIRGLLRENFELSS